MAIGTQGDNVAAKISAFTILPFVSGIFGIAAFVLHFSPMERFAREITAWRRLLRWQRTPILPSNPNFLPTTPR